MNPEQPTVKGGFIKRCWHRLRRPSVKYSVLSLLTLGFVGGIVFWGGFNTALDVSNTEAFCISCHEMRDNVYQEYTSTIHFSNRTGVRAICSDCHVPRAWHQKMARKIQASRELWGKFTGVIDTPEKFEAHRLMLARREWSRLKENGSLECRNCHAFQSMDHEAQGKKAGRMHVRAVAEGKTCIDCHKGIAHTLPEGMTGADDS